MASERQTKAVGYVDLAMVCGAEGSAQIQRHKDTIIAYSTAWLCVAIPASVADGKFQSLT